MFLEGVGPGLVHHVHQFHVTADIFLRQCPEGDFRQHGHILHSQGGLDGDRRAHVVRAPGEHPEHGAGFLRILRFAEGKAIQKNERIRADDGGIRIFPEHRFRFGSGVVQAEFLRRQVGVFQLLRIPDDDGERHAGLRQQIAPPR